MGQSCGRWGDHEGVTILLVAHLCPCRDANHQLESPVCCQQEAVWFGAAVSLGWWDVSLAVAAGQSSFRNHRPFLRVLTDASVVSF